MGEATLIVNFAILVVSGIAAGVAWWQAVAADRGKVGAETARDAAVKAQSEAALALQEANRIATDARDLMLRQDQRALERHQVDWIPKWDMSEAKFILLNDGPDPAFGVRFTIRSDTVGRLFEEYPLVEQGEGFTHVFTAYKNSGGVPRVKWRVEWRTPLGNEEESEGTWPSGG